MIECLSGRPAETPSLSFGDNKMLIIQDSLGVVEESMKEYIIRYGVLHVVAAWPVAAGPPPPPEEYDGFAIVSCSPCGVSRAPACSDGFRIAHPFEYHEMLGGHLLNSFALESVWRVLQGSFLFIFFACWKRGSRSRCAH